MLVVIGVVVSMAVLTFGDGRAGLLRREAERLHGLLRLAADEAAIRAVPMGVAVAGDGYRFFVYDPEATEEPWVRMDNDRLFGAHEVPRFVRLELVLDAGDDAADDDDGTRPDAMIRPTGEITPFEIVFRRDEPGPRWIVEGTLGGELTLHRED